ncbi:MULTISPECIES: AMP-binding protein [Bradyrhizobium]|uniref:Feruloyl-CoA synthase n=1 Tax=Bradyrhizobium ottawaense TaxID=931866 RepID=A0ABV4G140_9BRAD|nr:MULTISPECIES: AMP-binding protein [Bradyrhizobium]MBR1293751.1 AMP-binding protein [Bradyrhizobium ottawaense]MDA9418330.1 acyl-CoA synthetase [Bradyrhizobium sp. CCBAU 25360]MDA9484897.1 acyl-CoA synthetase [Bradyrhizobium sp. CCBAU 11445]PDT68220.1 acyl-CoA synthetase [Bradyrhizobium ottawaense]WLB49021.1 AMP-binding protein [Bradyrhizobium ottawaense]
MSTKALTFAPREVSIERRPDGALILSSPLEWKPCDWRITDFLPSWASTTPDRIFLAQRNAKGGWDEITYSEAWSQVQAVGQSLLDQGAKPADRLAILSGNSIENAVVSFAAMSIGVILASISPNYTLMPGGLARLKDIAEVLRPSFVFVQSGREFSAGRTIPELAAATWISVDGAPDTVPFRTLTAKTACDGFAEASRAVSCDAVAKILFTSGSTGFPKGVLNTHRMMASSLQMGSQLVSPPAAPVQVEWLPWHHTMGSNVILHGILKNGGTLYIDDGRPLPQLFHKTVANLKEVSPTAMFNVPAGYNLLCDAVEKDLDLGASVFKRMDRMSYAGAAISKDTLEKLYRLTLSVTGRRIPVMSGYGTTETAPTISTTHWATDRPGEIGLPAPGLRLKLIPVSDTYEVRVKGPNVTPGYLGRPDLTEMAFDEEGFYRIGDTVSFLDPQKPELGLRFTGRISENFKLANGTWVSIGNMRAAILAATRGVLLDMVVAGENREACALLCWLNPTEAARISKTPGADLTSDPAVVGFLLDRFRDYNETVGSSERICSFVLLKDPPSMAAGEITDKAYVNQRAVLKVRSEQVERLYTHEAGADVIRV